MLSRYKAFHAIVFVLAMVAGPVDARAQSSAANKLSLDEARRLALQKNHSVRALRLAVDEARARAERSSAAFKPTLGVAAGGEAASNAKMSEGGGIGYLYGAYNLFNGYRDVNQSHIGELEIEKATGELKAAEQALAVDVEEQFTDYLYRKSLIALQSDLVARNEKHKAMVRKSRALGTVPETDVMEFELVDTALRSELARLEQELENARGNLVQLLGDDALRNVEPVGSIPHTHIEGSLEEYLARVEKKSPQVLAAGHDAAIAKTQRSVADGRWLPRVDVETRYGFLPRDESLTDRKAQANILLTAKLDLYTGGDAKWERREREATVGRREAELASNLAEMRRAVESSFRSLRLLETRADVERDMIDKARRYYELVLAEYRRGVKNSADVKSASDRWAEAEVRRITLEHEAVKTRLALERALGEPAVVSVIESSNFQAAPKSEGGKR